MENVSIDDNNFGNFAIFNNKNNICSKRSSIFAQNVVEILIKNVSPAKSISSECDSDDCYTSVNQSDISIIVIDDTIIEDDSDNNNQSELDNSKDYVDDTNCF